MAEPSPAMVGAFLGLHGALLMLIFGSMAGSLIGYAYIRFTRPMLEDWLAEQAKP